MRFKPAANAYDDSIVANQYRVNVSSRQNDNNNTLPLVHDRSREHSEGRDGSNSRQVDFKDVSSNFDRIYNKRINRES